MLAGGAQRLGQDPQCHACAARSPGARQLRALHAAAHTWPPILPPHLQNPGATSLLEMGGFHSTPRSPTLRRHCRFAGRPPDPTKHTHRSEVCSSPRQAGLAVHLSSSVCSLPVSVPSGGSHSISHLVVVVCYNDL